MAIGGLQGTIAALSISGPRSVVAIAVQGVIFEVQILARQAAQLPGLGEPVQVSTHLQVRDDRLVLYGFGTAAERDLFRQLIAVSGVGPQLALALLDGLELTALVQAIVTGNTRLLAKTPGIGLKTAERIALELKTKLAEWRDRSGLATTPTAGPIGAVAEDVELTLLALGYTDREVVQALQAIGQATALSKTAQAEDWIREAIAWLSRD